MQLQLATAVTMALALALAACSSAPAQTLPTEPVETQSLPTLTPLLTQTAEPTAPPTSTGGSSSDDGNGWPVTVSATLAGTNFGNVSDGTYTATGPATICGNLIASIDPTDHSFTFEFPLDGAFNPRDVHFSADDLLPGTTTSLFNIGVSIVNSEGAEPPATVIRPDLPDQGDTGTATLTETDGKRTLTLHATSDFGETIQLTAVCGPAPG